VLFRTPATTRRSVGDVLNLKCNKSYKYIHISSSIFMKYIILQKYIFHINTNFKGRVSVVTTVTRIGTGRIRPRNPARTWDVYVLEMSRQSLLPTQRFFQRVPTTYRRVRSSVNFKCECVYAEIYSALCGPVGSTEIIL
jgi:hypothetical protein